MTDSIWQKMESVSYTHLVKETVVTEAVKKAGLTLVEVTKQGEWVSVTARKD